MLKAKYQTEEWKAIPGFEGRYSASNLGRIKSHLRHGGTNERILKPYPVRRGYLKVDLGGKSPNRKTMYVARLVTMAFIPPDPERPHVNHRNGNATDNRLENLEWCSVSENTTHRYRVLGRGYEHPNYRGEKNHNSKLTDEKVRKFRAMRQRGIGIREITRLSGLNRRSIQMMLRCESWRHIH